MNRAQNPVWAQCLAAVEPELESLGFRLASESAHYASFGSALVEYEHSRARIQLIWDGRDHWIDVKVARASAPDHWSALEALPVAPPPTNPRAHVLRPGIIADKYIANIVAALRGFASLAE